MTRAGVLTVTANPAIDHTVFVPGFTKGVVNRAREERRDVGGKGVNVAAFLATAGVPVAVTGFLGADNAAPFESFFAERGMADAFVRVSGATRTNLKVVDDRSGSITDLNFPGPTPSADDVERLVEAVRQLARGHLWVAISGSLPPGVPPDLYARLIHAARESGAEVALDSSGEAMRLGVEAGPSLINPNIEELSELLGLSGPVNVGAIVARLHRKGVPVVAVTMGAEGAVHGENGVLVETRPPDTTVVSTVGAGDASLAGFLIGRLAGRPLAECARLATGYGAAAVTTVGPRLPQPETLSELIRWVAVRTVEA